MNDKEINRANRLLRVLCEKERIGTDEIKSILGNNDDCINICNYLDSENLIIFNPINENYFSIVRTEKTCDGHLFLDELRENLSHNEPITKKTAEIPNNNPVKKSLFIRVITSSWTIGIFLAVIAAILNADRIKDWINGIIDGL